ncbi:MAG: DUF2336 domain-containing protein [Methylobacterium sp.]|nr:DUF2336 domain-containing protein [Methylobacterium sp.]
MLVTSFLAWIDRAAPRERAEAVDMLARAYLDRTLGEETPEAAEAALTLVLDDPDQTVRRALACALADHWLAPRHIVLALAADQPEVGAPLLARSPVLQEADLVDLAAHAEPKALLAMALRPIVTERGAHAIVSRAERKSCLALAGNPHAEIGDGDLLEIATRFGKDNKMRDALLERHHVPPAVRHQLMIALSDNLESVAGESGLLAAEKNRRMVEEALLLGTIAIAAQAHHDLPQFVRYLREQQKLTPGLLLRSVLGGDVALITEALADLAGMTSGRVAGLMCSRSDATLSALFRRAGLPSFLEQPLIAAVRAAQELGAPEADGGLSLSVVRAAQSACLSLEGGEEVRLLALLRRYEAEAARVQSRRLAENLRVQAQSDFPQGKLTVERTQQLAVLGAADEVIDLAEVAVTHAEPALAAPAKDEIPDLRTVINEWQRERDARLRAVFERQADPANSAAPCPEWDIRRNVA